MKRLSTILLLFALSLQLNTGYGQGDFAPIGAEWYYSWNKPAPPAEVGYIKLASVSDTVLNGQPCRRLQQTWIHKVAYNPEAGIDTGRSSIYLYSDSNGVYYFDGGLERFLPLYRFNVAIGDTVIYRVPSRFDFLSDTLFSMLITDITTSTIGGVPLKAIHHEPLDGLMGFGSGLHMPYTERIGVFGDILICHTTIGIAENPSASLRCYSDNEITYRTEPDIPCDYLEGTNKIEGIHQYAGKPIAIYPNPARDYVTIRNAGAGHPITSVEVYDIVGRKVKTFAFENPDQEQVLSIADLLPGNYVLKIKSNGQSIVWKLMVH